MPEHVESNTSSSTAPQTRPAYASPTAPAPRGKAPGMTYRLLAEHGGVREFVVIFATGDEVMSGIHDFATREHITAARLTAVGALERVTVGWLDRERRAYLEHPIDEQVELELP